MHGCEITFTEHFTHSETQVGPYLNIRMIVKVGPLNKTYSYLFTRCLQSKRINIANEKLTDKSNYQVKDLLNKCGC